MIESYWSRLKDWGRINAPAMLADLNLGASETDIAELELKLGLRIPEEFRKSLAIHNGEDDGWPNKVFANGGAYLDTTRIVYEWTQRLEHSQQVDPKDFDESEVEELIGLSVISVEGPVRPVLFQRDWIPIMEMNGDVFWALDMAPTEGGKLGQVIEVDWEGCSWQVIAGSFGEYMNSYVSDLEVGKYPVINGLPREKSMVSQVI